MKININAIIVKPMTTCNLEIEIPNTAKGWNLFCGRYGSEGAAQDLATELRSQLSKDRLVREVICKNMNRNMEGLSYYGASDTEPRAVLNGILNEIFGEVK